MTMVRMPFSILVASGELARAAPWLLVGLVPVALVVWLYRYEMRLVSRPAAAGLLGLRLLVLALLLSLVAFEPERISDSAVRVSDDEIRSYYDTHKKQFDRPGSAKVSILTIPRSVTAADSAANRANNGGCTGRGRGSARIREIDGPGPARA